jgi:cellulose biosynthesis protein BcsQ
MESICIFNNKGGVGKTTLLCNLAASLSVHQSKNVLIIDADPQCNATSYALSSEKIAEIFEAKIPKTIYRLVEPFKKGRGKIPEKLAIVKSPGFCVDIILRYAGPISLKTKIGKKRFEKKRIILAISNLYVLFKVLLE